MRSFKAHNVFFFFFFHSISHLLFPQVVVKVCLSLFATCWGTLIIHCMLAETMHCSVASIFTEWGWNLEMWFISCLWGSVYVCCLGHRWRCSLCVSWPPRWRKNCWRRPFLSSASWSVSKNSKTTPLSTLRSAMLLLRWTLGHTHYCCLSHNHTHTKKCVHLCPPAVHTASFS